MPALLARYMEGHPWPAYRTFLLETVAPRVAFAHVTALGEVAVGVSLTLGAFTVVGAVAGGVPAFLRGPEVQHLSPAQQGFHLPPLALMLAFAASHTGNACGERMRGTLGGSMAGASSAGSAGSAARTANAQRLQPFGASADRHAGTS